MFIKKILKILLVTLCFSSPQINAQNIDYLGSALWRGVYDVKVQSGFAYCAFASGMAAFDVSDSSSISMISQTLLPARH